MYLRNSLKFDINAQHVIGDTQYPRGWFLDPAERAKLGITEVADIPRPDTALFDSTENPDGTWKSTPKDPAVIEAERKARIPRSVTMRQARLALLGANLLPTINSAIAAMTGVAGEAARIEWEYSQEVHRDKALVAALSATLGLTDAQLDTLFTTAATL